MRDLARRAAMSERTFARRFVAETGTTPAKWLALQRLHHAQRLLEETDLGIESVATPAASAVRRCFATTSAGRSAYRRATTAARSPTTAPIPDGRC